VATIAGVFDNGRLNWVYLKVALDEVDRVQ
jgi:hypothetical protein